MKTISKVLNNLEVKYFIPVEDIMIVGKCNDFSFEIALKDGRKVNISADDPKATKDELIAEMNGYYNLTPVTCSTGKIKGVGFYLNQIQYKDYYITADYEENVEESIGYDGINDLVHVNFDKPKNSNVYTPYQYRIESLLCQHKYFSKHPVGFSPVAFHFATMCLLDKYQSVEDVLGIKLPNENYKRDKVAIEEMSKNFKFCYPIYEGEKNNISSFYCSMQDAEMAVCDGKINKDYQLFGLVYGNLNFKKEFVDEFMQIVVDKLTAQLNEDYVSLEIRKMDGTLVYSVPMILGSEDSNYLMKYGKYVVDEVLCKKQ